MLAIPLFPIIADRSTLEKGQEVEQYTKYDVEYGRAVDEFADSRAREEAQAEEQDWNFDQSDLRKVQHLSREENLRNLG